MKIFINGRPKTYPKNATIQDVINTLDTVPAAFVVELNQLIIQPETYSNVSLNDEDTIEIIRFVGGG